MIDQLYLDRSYLCRVNFTIHTCAPQIEHGAAVIALFTRQPTVTVGSAPTGTAGAVYRDRLKRLHPCRSAIQAVAFFARIGFRDVQTLLSLLSHRL